MEACSSSSDRTSTCASEPVRGVQIVGMPALGRSMHEATDIVADIAPRPVFDRIPESGRRPAFTPSGSNDSGLFLPILKGTNSVYLPCYANE
jgi:hypothetical protein